MPKYNLRPRKNTSVAFYFESPKSKEVRELKAKLQDQIIESNIEIYNVSTLLEEAGVLLKALQARLTLMTEASDLYDPAERVTYTPAAVLIWSERTITLFNQITEVTDKIDRQLGNVIDESDDEE